MNLYFDNCEFVSFKDDCTSCNQWENKDIFFLTMKIITNSNS